MSINAGAYEPGLAIIYQPARTTTSAGEPTAAGEPTVLCKRYIRFRDKFSGEVINQLRSVSLEQLELWMHKDNVTKTINTGMWVVHNGIKYGIIGHARRRYLDEVGFRVNSDT